MLIYKDLTDTQKQAICNGCGGKGGFINPPEFLFHASCNHHILDIGKAVQKQIEKMQMMGFING